MYDLSDRYDNTLAVMRYTVAAMQDVGFSKNEIEDYIDEATKGHNAHLVDVSVEYVNKCNEMSKAYEQSFNDYYSWSNAEDEDDDLNDDCLACDDYMYSKLWGRDFDKDEEDDDEIESYEGFKDHGQYHKYYWEQDFDF